MVVITNQAVAACPPEELFDYCVDLRNELEWNPTAKSMEKLTDGPVGVGTRFLARWKGAPSAIEVECLEFDRPLRWVHDNGGPIAVTFTGTVEPVDGGSLLRVRFDARPRGWFRPVFPAFVVMARRQERANMTYLREAVERRTGGGPGTGGAAAREMPLIHRILRRQFAEARMLVQEVPAADAPRVGAVADHLGFLLEELHGHHTTEDDLIWPKLLDRAGLDAPLVARMEEQHQQIDVSVAEVRAAMSVWRSDPTPATAAVLADRLGEFLLVLQGHLDEEEQLVVPLIDRHLTEAEWQEVGERGFEKFTPAQRWIALGQLVEVATSEEVAMMFGTLPPPVKVLWHLIGKRKYRRYITPVRGRQLV
ncbi:hemerythrin domain-containing protein [uncultured Nocardioides sp.]|uniref:hemerythrin domain-containing protein n=1 Tax=uncultured Nocardioides sp. TaxID=198441 RepID=UPI0026390BB3|nr:hemerythrin domain-containing protein [uncultured Nocardioides sp.]